MKRRHYVSIRSDVYDRLATEAAKRKVTISKLALESVADIVGDDEIEKSRRRYRRYGR